MKQRALRLAAAGLLVLAASSPAARAESTGAATELARKTGLEQLGALPFSEGDLTARRLLKGHLYDPAGREIGDIDDLIIQPDGSIAAVLAKLDASSGERDSLVRLPWSAVTLRDKGKGLTATIDASRPERYRLYPDEAPAQDGARSWRASELLRDQVDLGDRRGLRIVKDLVLEPAGKVAYVLVQSDLSSGARGSLHATALVQNRQGADPSAPWYKNPRYADDMAHLKVYPQTTPSKD